MMKTGRLKWEEQQLRIRELEAELQRDKQQMRQMEAELERERNRPDRFPLSALWDAYMVGAKDSALNEFNWVDTKTVERAADAYVKLVVSHREES